MAFHRLFLAAALLASAGPLGAQVVFQPLAISDADALAEQMRRLGTNPLDVDALLTAGELSLRLDDINAAGAFFSRAERIDPRNARAKAGEGALLVRTERPGEALRLFAQAEAMGLTPTRFAADRGLAYDLVGDQARAQRDYKLALGARADDETRRRYALSLAISGKQAQALDLLAPLIRQNDRAAWRSRAFILAMGGDGKEAARIAQTMMPPGSAAGLQGFFAELPRLPAIDRAFAVHFGEVHPTAARLADARLAPARSPLPVDAAPTQVAAVLPQDDRGSKRRKDKRPPVVLAAVIPPVAAPLQAPLSQPPAYRPRADVRTVVATPIDRPLSAGELASLSAAGMRSSPSPATRAPTPGFSSVPTPRALSPTEQANRAVATLAPPLTRTQIVAATPVPSRPVPAPVSIPAATVAVGVVPPLGPVPVQTAPVRAADAGVIASQATTVPPVALAAAPTVAPPTPGRVLTSASSGGAATQPRAASSDSLPPAGAAPVGVAASPAATAPIMATATPGFTPDRAPSAAMTALTDAETPPALVASTTPPTDVASVTPVPTPVVVTAAPALPRVASMRAGRPSRPGRAQTDSILARIVANLAIPASELGVSAPPGAGTRTPGAAERRRLRTADRGRADEPVDDKPAADRRQLAARKTAADKQAARDAADAARASRGEPERIWVQVAGGANERDLDKAWGSVRRKAPAALAGKQAWTTPLRATNRVLTGPFKTDAEARAYVNSLARGGVSAFTFTSEAGQKVSRLPSR